MIHAYSESYLSDVMDGLGSMLDYAVNSCGEDLRLFYTRFLSSGIAAQIERGNPRYLCGLSGVELAMTAAVRTGSPLAEARPLIDMGSPEYWTGWTLAYVQWYLGLDFKVLQAAGIDAENLCRKYPVLHEADLTKAVHYAQKAIERYRSQHNPLKEHRKLARLTQRELAARSGTTLRSIRAYEQAQLGLSNASAESIVRLSRVLGCTPSDLLD